MLAMNYTTQSDMWSMGVIIGEMFRGSEFIFGETEPDQMASIMENIGLPPVPFIEKGVRKRIYYGRDENNEFSLLIFAFRGGSLQNRKGFPASPVSQVNPKNSGPCLAG